MCVIRPPADRLAARLGAGLIAGHAVLAFWSTGGILLLGWLAFAGPVASQPAAGNAGPLAAPAFARVTGDGVNVDFAWWGIKGATAFEVLRATDPQVRPTLLATLGPGTLGYRDTSGGSGPYYYQIVATGARGARAASAWYLYVGPAVTAVSASGADTVVAWAAVPNVPGGYEIWRRADPQQKPIRVAAVGNTVLRYVDKQAGAGPFMYRIVARGAGGNSAAGAWYPYSGAVANTPATAAAGLPSPISATAPAAPTTVSPVAAGALQPAAPTVGPAPALAGNGLAGQTRTLTPTTSSTTPAAVPLHGFVDLHTHPMANLAFAGKLIYGGIDYGSGTGSLLPADPDCHKYVRASSEQQALGHDNSTHGGPGLDNPCGDALRAQVIHGLQQALHAADPPDDSTGYPNFSAWPTWSDITHQKMWVEWIRRSWVGGLRVLVALAVNNRTLADMVAGPGDGPDDDKASADRQLDELTAFVGRHNDFMEIAKSSADVQRIVAANKLAVVLGVEIDHIGNIGQSPGPMLRAPQPASSDVIAEVDRLYAKGVRYIFPVHVIDNAFGGTAVYDNSFNLSNIREAGYAWALQCAIPQPTDQATDLITYTYDPSQDLGMVAGGLAKLGMAVVPPAGPSCGTVNGTRMGQRNTLGLQNAGRVAIKEMMRLGMLIDIDHMSQDTMNQTLSLAEQVLPDGTPLNYPLNSGHAQLRGALPSATSERALTVLQYQRIAKLHGMVGVGSADLDAWQWLALYKKIVVDTMGGNAVGAFGTDTDGLAPGMPPRIGKTMVTVANPARAQCIADCQATHCDTDLRGKLTCDTTELTCENTCRSTNPPTITTCQNCNAGPAPAVAYDSSFPASADGTKTWNYNTDGVAHYGMLPDFLRDAAAAPGGAAIIDNNFMTGAEYFYRTWQIAEAKAGLAATLP